uniref:Short-chain dehydrogenase/reductase 3 n=3 Tax=Photinus pyralis TaxID=7054 RepID=A0A1Y1NA28_PHOPY
MTTVIINKKSGEKPITSHHETAATQARALLQLMADFIVLIFHVLWLVILGTYRLFSPGPKKSVQGEKVLITGAGHGIGRELALQYASLGATVIGWDVNGAILNETIEEIAKMNYPKAYSYTCNVTNREEVMKTAGKVQNDIGSVTILVNNAGIMPCHPFLEHSAEEIERVMNLNIMAHFWTLQAFLPDMIKHNHGHIVAVSSVAGQAGQLNIVPYSASKFAVRGAMEALHVELRSRPGNKIRLTTVYPYMVNTGLCKQPVIRFKSFLPLVNPEAAAKHIIDAQRRDIIEVTIPEFLLSLGCFLRYQLVKLRL